MEEFEPYMKFEQLVYRILKANLFDVQSQFKRKGTTQFDAIASLGDIRWAVEVKYYRTPRAQTSLINNAAAVLASLIGQQNNIDRGLLVLSCILPLVDRLFLEERFGFTIIDRDDLYNWTGDDALLRDELVMILEDSDLGAREIDKRDINKELNESQNVLFSTEVQDTHGSDLCLKLKELAAGRKTYKEHEKLCVEILEYLFDDHLPVRIEQNRTNNGLSIMDLVCRISSKHEFWRFLNERLNSQYIVFEFKNYTDPISQGQILTTEKYLMDMALRRVAIVMTRRGANKNAIEMTNGAMREKGRLILILDDEEICSLLHMKQSGDDPSDKLFDLADEFLMKLSR